MSFHDAFAHNFPTILNLFTFAGLTHFFPKGNPFLTALGMSAGLLVYDLFLK